MAEWNGWAGTILDVNLTTGAIVKKPLSRDVAVSFIGGSGFGAKVLYDELKPGADPLGPDNMVVVSQGVLSGTMAPSAPRFNIVTKSPQTGIFLRTSAGGFFGPELKWAGYDLIIIRGKSKKPVYLWVENDHAELRDASHLWGMDTWKTQQMIRDELGDPETQILTIGPSGENLGFSSCVINGLKRAAGKGASGAVWGSKRLKAIAVKGSKGVNIARGDMLLELCIRLQERLMQDPIYEVKSRYGTPVWVSDPIMSMEGDESWESYHGKQDNLLSSVFDREFFDKSLACFNCPIHCSHFYTVKEGKYKGTFGEGLEGNSVSYGGQIMGVNSAAFVTKYTTTCNRLGLHVDQPGCAIAWGMKLYEDGIINTRDTDGIELTWGNEEAILKLMDKIAHREGFGEILDGYPLKAAEMLGRDSLAYVSHVKGMTGRGSGIEGGIERTLALAVATRGRDHLTGAPVFSHVMDVKNMKEAVIEYGEKRYGDSRITTELWHVCPEKALLVYDQENMHALCDMTGLCKFASVMISFTHGYHEEDFAAVLSAVTGVDFTTEEIIKSAERAMLLERAFNAREGIRRIDDYPIPWYWEQKYDEPHPMYKGTEFPITKDIYDRTLDEYYRLRGCDLDTGIPSKEKLEQLGLETVGNDLMKRGILPGANHPRKRAR